MIKASPKPVEEILEYIAPFERILIAGCGGCTSVCLAGGQKEVNILKSEINSARPKAKPVKKIYTHTVERQCNLSFLAELDEIAGSVDCMLSMACGAGIQLLAERYRKTPVFPAVNTLAIGIDRDIGLYEESCRACGECVLAYTAGICPVTQCSKGLFNGPCGGTQGDKCEVSPDLPCAWHEIYKRLKEQNRLDDILKIRKPMAWQNQVKRRIVQKGYEARYNREE